MQRDAFVAREDRVPMCLQVLTEPALHECWSVNVSRSGLGVVASPRVGDPIPREGDVVDVQIALPDSGPTVRGAAEVRWRHDGAATPDGRFTVSMGLRFRTLAAADQIALVRYLETHRFRVAVAFASEKEARLVAGALGEHFDVHFGQALGDLKEILRRGDVSALLVCGDDEPATVELVEWLGTERAVGGLSGVSSPLDLAPRVVCAAALPAARLLGLFNTGRLFRALPPAPSADDLAGAVREACRDHGVRTEQRRVALALERALLRERAAGRTRAGDARAGGRRLVFDAEPMRRLMDMVETVAPHKVAVLLQGETGTGKEVVARAIHERSPRAAAPFVVQDCGTLAENLLESELFGHVRGAFTGAVADHPGLFVMADGGTVFLDEIENTTPSLQARLLRVLETGEVRPVGGTQVRQVDVRVVAAGNRDLGDEVRAGRLRPDLFFRLNTFVLRLPPLRERRGDVLPLAEHFLSAFNQALGRSAAGFAPDAQAALLAHGWPGNVRELRNAVERAVLLSAPRAWIPARLLPESMAEAAAAAIPGAPPGPSPPTTAGLRQRVRDAESALIRDALARHGGVVRRAARELAMDPVTLGRRARKYGLLARAPRPR